MREAPADRHCDRRGLDRDRLRPGRYQPSLADAVDIARHRITCDSNAISKSLARPEPVALTQPDDPTPDVRGDSLRSI